MTPLTAEGLRIGIQSITVTESRASLYTPELQLMAETTYSSADAAKPVAYEYLWFAGQPLAQIESATGTVQWYFNDHLGTPVLTTDAAGAVDWRVEREPYGTIHTVRTGAERHQPLAFPGQEDGGELSFNIFRWYRSAWGRYTQADPMGFFGTTNLYEYVGGNPVTDFDEFGLLSKTQAEAVMGIAGLTWYFQKMKDKDFIGADKYYHCMGHCSATKIGPGGCAAPVGT